MHIPDGILEVEVWGTATILVGAVMYKGVNYSKNMERYMDPVMGVMAAFIFASQMINFPLLGAAASGHLIGSALAEILFGFWPAFIMTTVITIKAFIFQDGGISVLGVNILNMAIIAPALAVLIKKSHVLFIYRYF